MVQLEAVQVHLKKVDKETLREALKEVLKQAL
jgi:DNA-binding FrmR family transcriptional regulator